jgi:hypothetical protein
VTLSVKTAHTVYTVHLTLTSHNSKRHSTVRGVMTPHNGVFRAIPFDASYEANEPLIPDGDAEEEEDQRLEEKALSRCKIHALLLGLLAGFFIQFSVVGVQALLIVLSGEDLVTKSKTNIVVFILLWSFFIFPMAVASLGFLRKLVTMTYSAVGGRSKDFLEELIWRMGACLGALGASLAWTMTGATFGGMRAQPVHSLGILVVAFVWCKIVVMCFATDSKPSSSSRSSAEETMLAV